MGQMPMQMAGQQRMMIRPMQQQQQQQQQQGGNLRQVIAIEGLLCEKFQWPLATILYPRIIDNC
jgi:hypothetical protein